MDLNKNFQFEFVYLESIKHLSLEYSALLSQAKYASKHAYAPYSNFSVGASALLSNNEICTGANMENAAYPQCLCAEMILMGRIHQFLSRGVKLKAIAVYSPGCGSEPLSPCGSCRQILLEQEERQNDKIELVLTNCFGHVWIVSSVSDMMPFSFGQKNLISSQP